MKQKSSERAERCGISLLIQTHCPLISLLPLNILFSHFCSRHRNCADFGPGESDRQEGMCAKADQGCFHLMSAYVTSVQWTRTLARSLSFGLTMNKTWPPNCHLSKLLRLGLSVGRLETWWTEPKAEIGFLICCLSCLGRWMVVGWLQCNLKDMGVCMLNDSVWVWESEGMCGGIQIQMRTWCDTAS